MLCYTYVTDIVRGADELGILRDALNQMQQGIILLRIPQHAIYESVGAQAVERARRASQ
jgi:hypothetical protein